MEIYEQAAAANSEGNKGSLNLCCAADGGPALRCNDDEQSNDAGTGHAFTSTGLKGSPIEAQWDLVL